MSCDPIKDMSSSALSVNPYVYCGNNPVVFTDPLGLKAPGPLANPDAGEDYAGHFGGNWISSWSIYSQGAYQGIPSTNMAFALVDALMGSMGLGEDVQEMFICTTLELSAMSTSDETIEVLFILTNTYNFINEDGTLNDMSGTTAALIEAAIWAHGAADVMWNSSFEQADVLAGEGTSTTLDDFFGILDYYNDNTNLEAKRIVALGHSNKEAGLIFQMEVFDANAYKTWSDKAAEGGVNFPLAEGGKVYIIGCNAASGKFPDFLEDQGVPYEIATPSDLHIQCINGKINPAGTINYREIMSSIGVDPDLYDDNY